MPCMTIRSEGDRARAIAYLESVALNTGPVHMQLDQPRTANQNALLWVWHQIVADYTGYAVSEIHQIVKNMLLPPIVGDDGVLRGQDSSTKTLGRVGMANFMEAYQAWALTELGVLLPEASPPREISTRSAGETRSNLEHMPLVG